MEIGIVLWWLFLNLLTIGILAFYSMEEMACVSFNPIRLHYYVSKGNQRAIWLSELLKNPASLFGTTLIGVNVAMFIGSECARQFYLALGLSPDLAPLTQVPLVIIFAELAPMFAARHYAEQVALGGAPLLYLTSKLMAPLLWCLKLITIFADKLTARDTQLHPPNVLDQEDLQRLLAAQSDEPLVEEDANTIARNIFSLRSKDASYVMEEIGDVPTLSAKATIEQLRAVIKNTQVDYLPLYEKDVRHIVAIAHVRDLIRISDNKRVYDYAKSPWFVTKKMSAMQILKEFRSNLQNAAIVLDEQGLAIGMITLSDLVDEIFGEIKTQLAPPLMVIDRTLPADKTVAEFNEEFDVKLEGDPALTLSELMIQRLGHQPEVGDAVYISPFEFTVEETSLRELKRINVRTRL